MIRTVGNDKTHLQLDISDSTGVRFSRIGYGLGYLLKEIKEEIHFQFFIQLKKMNLEGTKISNLKLKT